MHLDTVHILEIQTSMQGCFCVDASCGSRGPGSAINPLSSEHFYPGTPGPAIYTLGGGGNDGQRYSPGSVATSEVSSLGSRHNIRMATSSVHSSPISMYTTSPHSHSSHGRQVNTISPPRRNLSVTSRSTPPTSPIANPLFTRTASSSSMYSSRGGSPTKSQYLPNPYNDPPARMYRHLQG
eukprot:m.145229 g.145229  ORF g.145229 m.145229 type:complete len:181 (+) comp30429_c1_seq1:97-639(+)